jgi:hypothetical protein
MFAAMVFFGFLREDQEEHKRKGENSNGFVVFEVIKNIRTRTICTCFRKNEYPHFSDSISFFGSFFVDTRHQKEHVPEGNSKQITQLLVYGLLMAARTSLKSAL